MKPILASIAASALFTGAAFAFDYSTSFTAADGFVNGTINGQNTWTAFNNGHYFISDAAGTGLVGSTNAAGPVHGATSAALTTDLAAGKTITMTLSGQFNGPLVNQNSGRWILGIGDAASTSLTPLVGAGMFSNNATNFFLGDQDLSNPSKVDTGTALDTAFHLLTTTITRTETTNEFAVTVSFDGGTVSNYTITNAGLWDGTLNAIAGFRFQGNTAASVDSFSASSSGGGDDGTITISSTTYETGVGVTITYTSTVGLVDVYRNATGDLSTENFTLVAQDETGGTYVDTTADATVNPKAFYVLVTAGEVPFTP